MVCQEKLWFDLQCSEVKNFSLNDMLNVLSRKYHVCESEAFLSLWTKWNLCTCLLKIFCFHWMVQAMPLYTNDVSIWNSVSRLCTTTSLPRLWSRARAQSMGISLLLARFSWFLSIIFDGLESLLKSVSVLVETVRWQGSCKVLVWIARTRHYFWLVTPARLRPIRVHPLRDDDGARTPNTSKAMFVSWVLS